MLFDSVFQELAKRTPLQRRLVEAAWLVTALLFAIASSGCSQSDPSPKPGASVQKTPKSSPAGSSSTAAAHSPNSKGSSYSAPSAEEMAPMRSEYLAELAKILEPPEMTGRPMQVRKAASPRMIELGNVMGAIGSPEKATHEQRAEAVRALLEIANSQQEDDGFDSTVTYGAIAAIACLDGVAPQTIIEYASSAIRDDGDNRALRARMYLRAGDKDKALDDLEKVMASNDGHALAGGEANPRKESAPCGWSIAEFDLFGDDPRALAAKGLYLSSFIGYGAEDRGTVKESAIRDLYVRSAASWHSPIPHFLAVTVDGFGSPHSVVGARCMRANSRIVEVPETVSACATYDEETRQEIRELTMALVIEPTFAPALAQRADKYLQLAQGAYSDGRPSRQLFVQAISDFDSAISAGAKNLHSLYCDRGLALASIGRYQDASAGYTEGMKHAKNGVEDSPFVYEQLAGIYMKLGKFTEAADLMTRAIMNSSGGGMDAVIFFGGMKAFRILYPEYDPLPDEILADAVRRRYQPQFPQSWDADFISKEGVSNGKVASSILVDLYIMRGDAYMKAGRRPEALADFQRVKSDAWSGPDASLPRHVYFTGRGTRNFGLPERWPPKPPTT
jgi:tetratricopeptide (TPR) repeat protein